MDLEKEATNPNSASLLTSLFSLSQAKTAEEEEVVHLTRVSSVVVEAVASGEITKALTQAQAANQKGRRSLS
jgi:hypothetical protein